ASDWLFDRLPDNGNVVDLPPGIDEQMNVFRHANIGPQVEFQLSARRDERVPKPFARALRLQELVSVITRKRQFVSVAGLVVVAAMATFSCHSTRVTFGNFRANAINMPAREWRGLSGASSVLLSLFVWSQTGGRGEFHGRRAWPRGESREQG